METTEDLKKKEDINYEKLYLNIVELKQESKKTVEIFSEFFQNYINKNQSCNSKEIMDFLGKIEENKKVINSNIALQKRVVLDKNIRRSQLIEQQSMFLKNYAQISSVLNKNKRKYSENIQMSQSEINSLYYQVYKRSEQISSLKEEINSLEQQINQTKTENKNLCAKEYEYIYQILDNEKKMYEIVGEREKNLNTLNHLKGVYKSWTDKLDQLNKLKVRIVTSNQRKKNWLMRKAFQVKKSNEENRVSDQVHSLTVSLCKNKRVRDFTPNEASFFSYIFDNLKVFYSRQKEKMARIHLETAGKAEMFHSEAEYFKKQVSELLTQITLHYSDIKISDLDLSDFSSIADVLFSVNLQLTDKFEDIEGGHYKLDREALLSKQKVESQDEKIIRKFLENRKFKTKRKSFIILKNLAKVKIARRDRERAAERERAEKAERDKAGAERERLEKLRIEKEKTEREYQKSKALEEMEKEKQRLREKENELLNYETGFSLNHNYGTRNNSGYTNNNISTLKSNANINKYTSNYTINPDNKPLVEEVVPERKTKKRKGASREERKDRNQNKNESQPQNRKENKKTLNLTNELINLTTQRPVEALNKNYNYSSSDTNNRAGNSNNNISTTAGNNYRTVDLNSSPRGNKPKNRVDLSSLEESFSMKGNIELSSENILDEISKNIREVSEFPIKPTFGGKKKHFGLI